MALHGDHTTHPTHSAANVNDNPELRENQPSAHPIIIDVGGASSDSSPHSRRRSSHIQVTEGGRHGPRVEGAEGRHHRYTYIPSTSSFSRENSPRTSVPPIIIQQPSQHRYSHASYHDTPFITSQPIHGAHDSPYHQPQPAYNASPGYPPQPIPVGWLPGSFGHHHPKPTHDAQNIRIHAPYDRTSYYGAHSPTESVSQDAASTYIAVDPFRSSTKTSIISSSLPVAQDYKQHPYSSTPHYVVYPYTRRRTVCFALLIDFFAVVFTFFFNTLPRQVYLNFLLRLPAFYFSRVARIFEEAEMTMPEIEQMALQGMDPIALQQLPWSSPSGANLKSTWEGFIDSLLREWKTLNIISVLLLSAILTILQIDSAATDPVTRNTALFSLICALMSLLYGCMYIIRFSSMRKAYKALEWAQEAQKTKTLIWWNAWVLLAMPATWLAWSIMLYIACIMAFVWRADTAGLDAPANLSPHDKLSIRIAISVVLGIGVLYFALILNTLRLYGDSMDENFRAELERLVREKKEGRRYGHGSYHRAPHHYSHSTSSLNSYTDPAPFATPYQRPSGARPGRDDYSLSGASSTASFFKTVKIMGLHFHQRGGFPMPDFLVSRDFKHEDWEKFISEESQAWDGDAPLFQSRPFGSGSEAVTRPQDSAARILAKWNQKYFNRRKTMGLLCHEYVDHWSDSPTFAIYLVDISSPDGQPFSIADRFGPVPEGLTRIDIFDQPGRERSRRRILGRTSIFSTQNPVDGRVHFGGQVHERSPERRSRSSSRSSRSSSPYRPSERRPSGDRRSRRSERNGRSRRSPSRSYSPRREVPWRLPYYNPPTPYHPTAVPPTTVIVVPQSPSPSSSSSPPRRTSSPLPHRTDDASHATGAEVPARPRTKSEGDAFRPSSPSNSYERPITPRAKSRRNTLRTQTTESESDLLVFPSPSSHSSRRPFEVHTKGTEPSTSKPRENIVADGGDAWYQRSGTGNDVLPPRRKPRRHSPSYPRPSESFTPAPVFVPQLIPPLPPRQRPRRHSPGFNPRPSESFTPAPVIVPQLIPPASEPFTAHVRVKTPRGRPPSHEAAVHELHRSPSPQSFKSFSRSPSRSRSPSDSVPPATQPPPAMYDQRSQHGKARFGIQRQEHATYVDDQLAGGMIHGPGRSRELRAKRSVDSEQPMAGQVGSSSPIHRQPHTKGVPDSTKLPSRNRTPDPASSPTHGLPSALDEGPWTRDRSSLRTIMAPPVDGNPGGAFTS